MPDNPYQEGYDEGYADGMAYVEEDQAKLYEEAFDEGRTLREIESDDHGFTKFLADKLGIYALYHKEVLQDALVGDPGARYQIIKLLGETDV